MTEQLTLAGRPEPKVCTNCRTLKDRNEHLLIENEQLTNECSGLMYTTRKLSASAAALQRELHKVLRDDPKSKDIEFVITRWKRLTGHPRVKCPPDGSAWKAVKRALGPWEYSLEEVLEVVEGVALAPYDAGFGRRKVTGTPRERKDDLAYALRDETKIDMFRDIARRGRQATADQLFRAYQASSAACDQYARLLLDALARKDSEDLLVARAWHYSVDAEVDSIGKAPLSVVRGAQVIDISTRRDAA